MSTTGSGGMVSAGSGGASPGGAGGQGGMWNPYCFIWADLENEPGAGGAAGCPSFGELVFSEDTSLAGCRFYPAENEPIERPPDWSEGDCCYAIDSYVCR